MINARDRNARIESNIGLIIDRSAVVSAYGTVNVAVSEHQYFSSDSIAVRCAFRLGQNVLRPSRIAMFTVAGGGS